MKLRLLLLLQKKLSDLLKMSEEVFHSLASPADDLRERRVMTDTVLKVPL